MTPNKKLWVAIGIIILVVLAMIKLSLFIAWHGLKGEYSFKDKSYCQERGEFCTQEYNPVCGWFSKKVQCINYPCAETYSNSCVACADEKVKYWTPGSCR